MTLAGAIDGLEALPSAGADANLLVVEDLRVIRRAKGVAQELLSGISFEVAAGARIGMVGESGSGKSLTGSAILGLLPQGISQSGGRIVFAGRDLITIGERELHAIRGAQIAMIYQNALASLNPLFPVGKQIAAVCRAHLKMSRKQASDRALSLLEDLGVPDPARRVRNYPHQFSGGMAQRVAIAIAIACSPRLLIADEPTTGLDATIQLQVLETIGRAISELGSALLLISHDLSVIEMMTERVVVVYAGMVLESGPTATVMAEPLSPYTKGLVECARPADDGLAHFIPGRIPEPGSIGEQCPFADRCSLVRERCRRERPRLRIVAKGHAVACHAVEEG